MARYYVNKNPQSTGEHEVHSETCSHLPATENREYLGQFSSCYAAVDEGAQRHPKVDGCHYCGPECHKG